MGEEEKNARGEKHKSWSHLNEAEWQWDGKKKEQHFCKTKWTEKWWSLGKWEKPVWVQIFPRDGSQMPPQMGVEKNDFHVNFWMWLSGWGFSSKSKSVQAEHFARNGFRMWQQWFRMSHSGCDFSDGVHCHLPDVVFRMSFTGCHIPDVISGCHIPDVTSWQDFPTTLGLASWLICNHILSPQILMGFALSDLQSSSFELFHFWPAALWWGKETWHQRRGGVHKDCFWSPNHLLSHGVSVHPCPSAFYLKCQLASTPCLSPSSSPSLADVVHSFHPVTSTFLTFPLSQCLSLV